MSVTVYHSDLSYYVCTVYTGFILYCPVSLFNLYHTMSVLFIQGLSCIVLSLCCIVLSLCCIVLSLCCIVLSLLYCPVSLLYCPVSLLYCPVSLLYCPVSLLYCPVSLLYCPVSLFNLYHCDHTSYSLNHMTFYDMEMHLIKEDGFQIEHLLFIMSYGYFLALSCRDRCTSYALI